MVKVIHGEGTVTLRLISAKGLIAADRGGTSDPYTLIVFPEGTVAKGKTVMKTVNPEWDDTLVFHINRPFLEESKITIDVIDYDRLSKDDFIGRAIVPVASFKIGEWTEQDFELGVREGKKGDAAKGSIKIAVKYDPPTDFFDNKLDPVVTCEDTRRLEHPSYVNTFGANFDLILDKWSGKHWDHRYVVVLNDFVYWFGDKSDTESKGFIIFNKDTEIGVGPGRGCNINEEERPYCIHIDTPMRDLTLDPGSEQARDAVMKFFGMHMSSLGLSITNKPTGAAEPVKGDGTLTIKFDKGEDLPPMDKNGKADPYIVLTLPGGTRIMSKPVKANLSPVWDEEVQVFINRPFVGTEIGVEVYDWDATSSDDFMGKGSIQLAEGLNEHNVKLEKGQVMFSTDYKLPNVVVSQNLEPVVVCTDRSRIIDPSYTNNCGAVRDGLMTIGDKEYYFVLAKDVLRWFKDQQSQGNTVGMYMFSENTQVNEMDDGIKLATDSAVLELKIADKGLRVWWRDGFEKK